MILDLPRLIFVHFSKTGGNSIQDALRDHSADEIVDVGLGSGRGADRFEIKRAESGLTKHSNMMAYQEFLGESFVNFRRFCILRDPFDRLLSYYFSPHRGKELEYRHSDFKDFKDFKDFIEGIPPLEFYLMQKNDYGDHFIDWKRLIFFEVFTLRCRLR